MLTWEELQELKQLYEAAPVPALESPLAGERPGCAQQQLASTTVFLLKKGSPARMYRSWAAGEALHCAQQQVMLVRERPIYQKPDGIPYFGIDF